MGTFSLDRKITKLCGNVLIVVSDTDIKLTSSLSNSSLTDHQFKNVMVNPDGNYASDLQNIFSKSERTVLFSGDDFEIIEGKTIKTLYVDDIIPSRFVIMSTNNSDDLSDHTIKKSFDMSDKSDLGKYIREHISKQTIKLSPININFEENFIDVNGVDVLSGSITTKRVGFETLSNETLSNVFIDNNIIPSNLFQLAFDVDNLEETDYGIFVEEIELGVFQEIGKNLSFTPTIYDGTISGNVNIEYFSGVIPEISSNVAYYYTKADDVISSSSNINNNSININNNVVSKFNVKVDVEFEILTEYNNTIVLELTSLASQNDSILFSFDSLSIKLVADSLFNNPNFGVTDAERFVFNPDGNIEDQCESIKNAFNNMVDNSNGVVASNYGNLLVIQTNSPSLSLLLNNVTANFGFNILENTSFGLDKDVVFIKMLKSDYSDDFLGDSIKSKIGYHKILNILPFINPVISNDEIVLEDIDKYVVLTADKKYFGEIDTTRLWVRQDVEFGVLSVIPNSTVFNGDGSSVPKIYSTIDKYLPQSELVVGETYTVVGGKISSGGIDYYNTDFVAIVTEFEKITDTALVYTSKYYYDTEVRKFIDNISTTSDEQFVQDFVEYSWSINNALSVEDTDMFLLNNPRPDFDIKEPNEVLYTHDWFYISNELGGEFDEDKFYNQNYDYFEEYFNESHTQFKLNTNIDKCETIFKGVKLRADESFNKYKFTCLLNTKTLVGDIYQSQENILKIKLIKNDKYKSILLLLNIGVSDWKAFDGINIIVDKAYMYMMTGIKKYISPNNFLFGDEFTMPPVSGITFLDTALNPTDKFRGIKLMNNFTITTTTPTNAFEFVGDTVDTGNWLKHGVDDFGGLIGINPQNSSIVSTFKNSLQGTGNWDYGDKIPFNVVGNTITFSTNQIFVISINGTIFDQILPVNYIKGFVNFNDYEWYQVIDVEKCYEDVQKMVSFSGIKSFVEDNRHKIYSDIDTKVEFLKPDNTVGNYDGDYMVSVENVSLVGGDIIGNNWMVQYKTWVEQQDKTWLDFNNPTRLGLVVGKEININKK